MSAKHQTNAAGRGKVASVILGGWLIFTLLGCSVSPPENGVEFVLVPDSNSVSNSPESSKQLDRIKTILRKRIDNVLGFPLFFEPANGNRLVVKLPVLNEEKLDAARRLLTKRGLLEFCMVHTNSAEMISAGLIPAGYRVLNEERMIGVQNKSTVVPWLVQSTPERGLTGRYLRRAMATRNPMTGAIEIAFEFNDEGASLFERITTDYQPRGQHYFQLGIAFDGTLYSAPRILSPITGGRGMISGDFTPLEGLVLATLLEMPLESGCQVVQERTF